MEDADQKLAAVLPGVTVCLDGDDEDPAFYPDRRAQPLGEIITATPAGDHVLATVMIDLDAFGADRIVECLDRGELRFGLWGTAEITPEGCIVAMRPTSVRITHRRRLH